MNIPRIRIETRPLRTHGIWCAVLASGLLPGFSIAQAPLVAFQDQLATAIEKAEASVVAIARVRRGSTVDPTSPSFIPAEYATGVVIDANKVLTNYHVLGDPALHDYWVWHRGAPLEVTKIEMPKAADPWLDLAVLEIKGVKLRPIAMGDAAKLRKGHVVVALGNPFAIARDGHVSASLGIVSNLGRKAPPIPDQDSRETLHQLGTLIQVDARLPRGASGGALININGEMVGMTIALAAMAEEQEEAGFAIPADATFKSAVKKLVAGQVDQYGYLGVLPSPLPLDDRREGRSGVIVQNVMPGTPAAISGLRRLDWIIEVDGQQVDDPDHLVRLVSSRTAGSELTLRLMRGSTNRSLRRKVVLSKKRVAGVMPVISEKTPQQWRGAEFEYMTAMPDYPFHSYKVDALGCVGLTIVEEESPMWKAGFRAGDYVSHVSGARVTSPEQFFETVRPFGEDSVKLRRPSVAGKPAMDMEVSSRQSK